MARADRRRPRSDGAVSTSQPARWMADYFIKKNRPRRMGITTRLVDSGRRALLGEAVLRVDGDRQLK